MKLYLNEENYSLKKYQVDTTLKSKNEFLKKMKAFDKDSYEDLYGVIGLNEHNFPQEFLITDIDNDGNKEYFITEAYEGITHFNYFENGKKYSSFLDKIPYYYFLIENPEKIWLIAQPSYLEFDRFELGRMLFYIYQYNFPNQKCKLLFTLYEAWQIPKGSEPRTYIDVYKPKNIHKPNYFILNKPTQIFSDWQVLNNYFTTGVACEGTSGWILYDSLDYYYAILDTNTRYIDDSLGQSLITYKEKGYMMCWIRKENVDFPLNNGIIGTYKDLTTEKYLRFFESKNGINISYFTQKTFENNLRVVSFNKIDNKVIVKFNSSEETFQLEFKNNFKSLECINPDSTKQIFYKQ